ISLALVVYVFSALTLTLSRIMQGSGVYRGWSHLFYITSFYVFYGFSGTMQETYWAVFVSGLVILGLENYSIRTFCGEAISEEREKLERMQEEKPRGGT
ncbi:MAG: menaquinol oxidoreductase, partial [bacterium]